MLNVEILDTQWIIFNRESLFIAMSSFEENFLFGAAVQGQT